MAELAIKPRLAVVLGTGDTEIRYIRIAKTISISWRDLVLCWFIIYCIDGKQFGKRMKDHCCHGPWTNGVRQKSE